MRKFVVTLTLTISMALMNGSVTAKPKPITKATKPISSVALTVTDSCGKSLPTTDWWITWSYNPTAGTVVSPNRNLHNFKTTESEWTHLKVKTLKHGEGKHSYYPGVSKDTLKLSVGDCK